MLQLLRYLFPKPTKPAKFFPGDYELHLAHAEKMLRNDPKVFDKR